MQKNFSSYAPLVRRWSDKSQLLGKTKVFFVATDAHSASALRDCKLTCISLVCTNFAELCSKSERQK